MNRRNFLQLLASTAVPARGQIVADQGRSLRPYVTALPIPPVLEPNVRLGAMHYRVAMRQGTAMMHPDLPPVPIFGYQGIYPGPTLRARPGQHVIITWENALPVQHILPVDQRIHGAMGPETRTITHLHAGRTTPRNDGYPDDWHLPGTSRTHWYPNPQGGSTLWYHDHALGTTRLNVYAGLAGFYLIEDNRFLPAAPFDIPLLLQDRSFKPDGTLFYPETFVPEFFGQTITVNGAVWPVLDVEPRPYRLRLLNGANGRFFRLTLSNGDFFHLVGTDGGLLPQAMAVERLLLTPAERIEVLVDFTPWAGETIMLHNDAQAPYPSGAAARLDCMAFRVCKKLSGTPLALDETLRAFAQPRRPWQQELGAPVRTRDLALTMRTDPIGQIHLLDDRLWDDPITEEPLLGAVEHWRLINLTPDTHPIHLHSGFFQVLGRARCDVARFQRDRQVVLLEPEHPPQPWELGQKDTVCVHPGEMTRIAMRFGPFPGRYVWHCHMLEHEDYEMMRPFVIRSPLS